jgi:hypothetical protein
MNRPVDFKRYGQPHETTCLELFLFAKFVFNNLISARIIPEIVELEKGYCPNPQPVPGMPQRVESFQCDLAIPPGPNEDTLLPVFE